ncbi:hypothetical protein SFR_1203 [Streptomyces sp. FR-008]|nr:hypothetical protein SFR_1203 [Streptomyces sp. FR-008]
MGERGRSRVAATAFRVRDGGVGVWAHGGAPGILRHAPSKE